MMDDTHVLNEAIEQYKDTAIWSDIREACDKYGLPEDVNQWTAKDFLRWCQYAGEKFALSTLHSVGDLSEDNLKTNMASEVGFRDIFSDDYDVIYNYWQHWQKVAASKIYD
ncbi:uncharacterized protein [Ptychodera flava]